MCSRYGIDSTILRGTDDLRHRGLARCCRWRRRPRLRPTRPSPNGSKGCGRRRRSIGVSRKTFSSATHQLEPDLTLPDLDIPGRKSPPPSAGRVRADAGRLRQGDDDRAACRARQEARRPTTARRSRAIEQKFGVPGNVLLAIWGRETAFGGYKLPKNAHHGAGDAGLLRQAQGHVPPGASVRVQDAGGGPRQARRHAQLLGRRHGAHAVPAVGVLQIRRRLRRRRQEGHLELGAGCARLGGGSNSSARAGSAACAGPTRCARRRDVDCTIGVPEVTQPVERMAASAAMCRPMGGGRARPR